MNFMDMLPVDLLPVIWQGIYGAAGHDPHHAYLRVVPTADLSITMGLSISVLLVCLIYNVKIKGAGSFNPSTPVTTMTINGISTDRFDTKALTLYNTNATTQIEFTSTAPSGKFTRWFLDDICINK
jgi:F0F1-type ATP synthase membrane subunit a